MGSLSDAKSLGGIGSILAFFPVLNIVGWILILFGIREASEVLQDRTIFDDAIIAALTSIIGSVAFVAFLFGGFGFRFFLAAPGVILWALILLGVLWISWIISSIFLKRTYDKIGYRLGVGEFGTAGILLLVGSLLAVVGIGFLIVFIALIFQAVAYFSIHDRPPQPMGMPYPPPPPMAPPPIVPPSQLTPPASVPQQSQTVTPAATQQQPVSEVKYCFRCGLKLSPSASFCSNCGTKQA